MSDINYTESPVLEKMLGDRVAERLASATARARAEARIEGKAESKVETLLRLMQKRRWAVPPQVATAIRGCTDLDKLDGWFDAAIDAGSIDEFRRTTNL